MRPGGRILHALPFFLRILCRVLQILANRRREGITLQNVKSLTMKIGVGEGPWIKSSNSGVNPDARKLPIDKAVGFADFLAVAGFSLLWHGLFFALRDGFQSLEGEFGTDFSSYGT